MLFLRYESFKQFIRLYPVIAVILLVQLLLFILMQFDGGTRNMATLLKYGAMFGAPGFAPEFWRYFTAIFLHGSFEHLLFNCFALFVFSPPIERFLGKWKFILFYIVCGIVGNIVSYQFHAGIYVGVGASGAIYGIFAALLYLSLFRRDIVDYQSKKTITIILVIGVIYSIVFPNVDLYAHVGGFIGGFALFSIMNRLA